VYSRGLFFCSVLLLVLLYRSSAGAEAFRVRPPAAPYDAPPLSEYGSLTANLGPLLERFSADRRQLQAFYNQPLSPMTNNATRQFLEAWKTSLGKLDFNSLSQNAKVDYILFAMQLDRELQDLADQAKRNAEIAALIPFAETITRLQETRQRVDPLEPERAASTLAKMNKDVEELQQKLGRAKPEELKIDKKVAGRASEALGTLRTTLRQWFQFYDGYDPLFRWWVAEPHKSVDATLEKYATFLRDRLGPGARTDRDLIIGNPVGREALLADLKRAMIPYPPEDLVEIANKEFAWCDREMLKASREMGFGDDWKKALEKVKTMHVSPGKQPALIIDLAVEAIDFLEKHNLITVPPLAKDTWRVDMMSPQRQRVNPFFTGGPVISVSFPTDSMSHEQKLMSMRGNNIPFSRATVFHELLPGHNLQNFMTQRYLPYRRQLFGTPFWTEGWALYWEMVLWDKGFHKTPEDRVGALFWRMHRCARIVFSLGFHLGKMKAMEAVDYLVDRVGHERENAAAEVRRSVETSYPPLYQAAYMLGALQFRSLRRELVDTGKMTERDFHDAILKLNSMPVEMVRASLIQQPLTRSFTSNWKFYGPISAAN
jgi:uncharacterized protein (DUF885 family)